MKIEQGSKQKPEKTWLAKLRVPGVIAGVGALAAAGALSLGERSPSHEDSVHKLRAHAVEVLDNSTGCYDFGSGPVVVAGKTSEGKPLIKIPIKDSSTHQQGQDSWQSRDRKLSVGLIDSGFSVQYPVVGGKKVQQPLSGEIGSDSSGPESTEYNLFIAVNPRLTGEREANVYYDADVALTGDTDAKFASGERFCGRVNFSVGNDGQVTELRATQPQPDETQLQVNFGDSYKPVLPPTFN